ncbi:uncharacterized protein KGF55_002697 [Candida pseudojiufengensis]|uniref:uncharacterized protein n=1 Tax=Candida pseudojiufengensis TaxID=497109 RepID=UPI002224BD03|nr:uncharacterized protein KGF55_002697 [Candida pseudojiufengensis]KAI5963817.1 hypothetical protein KGF55_002697 [Candida pseudojiufengensis]
MSIPSLPFKVKTKISWPGEESGDLGFMENEMIHVLSIVDESWWSGKLRRNGAEGIFPKDYVEILEDKSSNNSSNSNLATPIKKNINGSFNNIQNTKNDNSMMNYKLGNFSSNDMPTSQSYDRFNQTFDGQPSRSNKLNNNSNNRWSFNEHANRRSLQHDDLEREHEIEYFKRMQQQQNYHIKSPNIQDQRRIQQHNQSDPNLLKHHHSQQNFTSPKFKSNSYVGINDPNIASQMYPSSPYSRKSNRVPKEQEILKEYEEIAKKRAELEIELQRLKRNNEQQASIKSPSPSPNKRSSPTRSKDDYSIDSYGTMNDEKRYQSRDDLSKKMSKYISDEDEEKDHTLLNYMNRESDNESPPPPPPPKHSMIGNNYELTKSQMRIPFDGDDFKISSNQDHNNNNKLFNEEDYKKLYLQQEELKNSIKSLQSDVMNLSELSATSAGSFMRHKYEKEFQESSLNMSKLKLNEEVEEESEVDEDELEKLELKSNVMESVFEDRKKNNNIFKKLLKKSTHEQLNPMERKLQLQDEIDIATYKMDINRMNSLTSKEKQLRTKRVVRKEGNLVIKPLDYVSEINTNETTQLHGGGEEEVNIEDIDFTNINYDKVEHFVSNYEMTHDLNDFISDVSMKFYTSNLNKIRAILLHLCKIKIIEESSTISQQKPKLIDIQLKNEASIFQINYIFKKILDALKIPCEIVLGFWKKPNEFYHNEQYVINHCWLSVLIQNQFKLIDILNFQEPEICNLIDKKYNEFYFLSKPLSLISTHIPSIIDLQHVMPPIDPSIAFYLPRTYSGFYLNNLSILNFNNALTRLKNSEIFEIEIYIPINIEIFTLIKTSNLTTNDLTLCQIKWINNKRIAKIKAILPKNESIGVLQIFSGQKGLQKHFNNIHQLSIVIPLIHEGKEFPKLKFVQRFPTVQSLNNDLYIIKPQSNKIIFKNSYQFEIEQFPSFGITNNSMMMIQDFKIVIESPSGKYFKLIKEQEQDQEIVQKPFGKYVSNIKCQEIGLYRGLVIGDNGNSWYVFAQWESVNENGLR